MKVLFVVLTAFVHAAFSIGVGFSIVFALLDGPNPIDGWQLYLGLLADGLARPELARYTLNLILCILLLPLVDAGFDAVLLLRGKAGIKRIVTVVPLGILCLYLLVLQALPAVSPGRLTVVAGVTVRFASVMMLAFWLTLTIPLAMLASRLAARLSRSLLVPPSRA